MTDLKTLETIYKLDKKIFNVYQKIKRKIIQNISFEKEKKELNDLVGLEDYLFEKLHLDEKNLNGMIEFLSSKLENTNDKRIALDFLYQKEKCLEENDAEKIFDTTLETMITIRLLRYLENLNYLKEQTKKNIRTYSLGPFEIPQLEDLTDIYVNQNYYAFKELSKEEFVEYARSRKEKVYAFNTEVKKKLEQLGNLDFNAYYLYSIDTVAKQNTKDSSYYVNYEYDLIFMNKDVEKIMIDLSFDIELILWIIPHDKLLPANRKFIKIYRSHISFEIMKQSLQLLQYINIKEIFNSKFDLFEYSLNKLLLKTCISFLTEEDYKAIVPFLELSHDNIRQSFSVEKYKKLQKNLNL